MKTYCKNIDITSYKHLNDSFDKFIEKGYRRKGIKRFLKRGRKNIINSARQMLLNHNLILNEINYFYRTEPTTLKTRLIARESAMQQYFDYIAVVALKPMFDAKIGYHQCASIKGKGQAHAQRYLKRWVRDLNNKYYVKLDIRKFYESVDTAILMSMLEKDVKNKDLLWLIETLISTYKKGLNIGSFLSQYLANYYLSEAYRYANNLYRYKRDKRVKLAKHILVYMDDWIFIGSNKTNIKNAVKQTINFIEQQLKLEVKPWKICQIDSEPIDMVGWVFRRQRTSIRDTIFLRARRAFKRAARKQFINPHAAARCISYWGFFKWADNDLFEQNNNLKKILNDCKNSISLSAIEKNLNVI